MRIGLVCPYNMELGGGVQECVLALREELSRRGHYVRILTPKPRNSDKDEPRYFDYIGTATEVKSPFSTTGQVASGDGEKIQELLDAEEFDIIHFHEPWVPMVSRQLLTRSQSVNVATFHAKLPGSVVSRTIEKVVTPYTKSILKYLDGLSAVSEAAASYVRTLTTRNIHLIPNGIDLRKYRAKQPKPGRSKPYILYIGRLERRKGVKYLLKAFQTLQASYNQPLELVIAGDGVDRKKLEQFVADNEIASVTFLGYVDEPTKLSLLQHAAIFCSPALFGESFGIVLLEAMAMQTVTVAGNNDGYKGVMTGSGDVSLVNPKKTQLFADRLRLLLSDESLRKAWQEWATTTVNQYDYPLVVDGYEGLYKSLLQARSKRT